MKKLGVAVGFPESNAEIRIAQYENDSRTPKPELLERIARELAVSPKALSVPDFDSIADIMHVVFAIEDICHYRLNFSENDFVKLKNAFDEWGRYRDSYKVGEISREQYDSWRYNYN